MLWTEAFPPRDSAEPSRGSCSPTEGLLSAPAAGLLGWPGPSLSPDQPLLPRADRDWRAGGGPGAGPGALHPPPLRSAGSREDSAGGSGAPRVPTCEARYRWGRRSPAQGHRAGRVLMSTLQSIAGLWAALVARPASGRLPSLGCARDSGLVIRQSGLSSELS